MKLSQLARSVMEDEAADAGYESRESGEVDTDEGLQDASDSDY
jgi:hypothetical protein